MIKDKPVIIVIGLNRWVNPFQAVFSWNHSASLIQADVANCQPNSMKGISNTQYHETFKKIKPNIKPRGNVMHWKLASFKVSPLMFSKSSMFFNFPFLLQKNFKETKLSIILCIHFTLLVYNKSINLSLSSYL